MITTTFEEQLERYVDVLPKHKNVATGSELPIRFNWGTQEKLNQFMLMPESVSKYPLIWLVEQRDEENSETENISRKGAKIIIATQSLGANRFNPEIYKTDYKDILNPIKNNLIKALESGGISILGPKYKVFRVKDYSWRENGDKPATTDIWNVIIIEADITFLNTERCINTIKF